MKVAIIDRAESLVGSVVSDLTTFGCLVFSIWFSGDSKLWMFVTCVMMFLFVCAKLQRFESTRKITFNSKEELAEWVEKLEWSVKKSQG